MSDVLTLRGLHRLRHDLRQPLNVIGLACGNLRARIGSGLSGDESEYFETKIARIEHQVARAVELIDEFRDVCDASAADEG